METVSENTGPEYIGVAPALLLSQVGNAAPYVFDRGFAGDSPFVSHLRFAADAIPEAGGMTRAAYYHLCIAAHFATVATYVPTDLDVHIRLKIWRKAKPAELEVMAALTLDAQSWDSRPVSTRWITVADEHPILSGHLGEWFSIAAAAYAATRAHDPHLADAIGTAILAEVARHARLYAALEQGGDPFDLLRAATITAHNLGDLDRVFDLWRLAPDDPVRREAYHAGQEDSRFPPLMRAGNLNKALMAADNHRHYALRAVRWLRRDPSLLLPIGPFFDDWGALVGAAAQDEEELATLLTALIDGWLRLKAYESDGPPHGYARAVNGIAATIAGGMGTVERLLPTRLKRCVRQGLLADMCRIPRQSFEERLARLAFKHRGKEPRLTTRQIKDCRVPL